MRAFRQWFFLGFSHTQSIITCVAADGCVMESQHSAVSLGVCQVTRTCYTFMIRRGLTVASGSALILLGLIITPMPIPLGIILIVSGLSMLVSSLPL